MGELERIEMFRASSVGLGILNTVLPSTDASFESFEKVLIGTGVASDELRNSLGGLSADQVIAAAVSGKAFDEIENGAAIQELLNATNADGTLKYAELLDGVQGSAEMQTFFNAILEEGTAGTVAMATGIENMKNAFRESEQKVGEFVATLKKSTKFGPIVSELQNITNEMDKMFAVGDDGELINAESLEVAKTAIFQTFGEMGKGFNDLIIGPIEQETMDTARAAFNAKLKELEAGNAEQRAEAEQMKKNGFQAFLIAQIFGDQTDALKEQVDFVKQLVDNANNLTGTEKTRLSILKSQETAVKALGAQNTTAARELAENQNKQKKIVSDRLNAEARIQEQLLSQDAVTKIAAGDLEYINSLKGEEKERAFALYEKYEEIRKNDELIKTEREIQLDVNRALYEVAVADEKIRKEQVKTLKAQTKELSLAASIAAGRGGQESPAAKLKAEKAAAAEKVKAAKIELSLLETRLDIEGEILLINLEQAGYDTDSDRYKEMEKRLNKRLEREKDITREKIKQAEAEERMVGESAFKGLLSDTTGSKLVEGTDLFTERFSQTSTDEDGNVTNLGIQGFGATSEERQKALEGMNDALKPMRDELSKLGPEGEYIVAAQEGILTMASAFDIIGNSSSTSADKFAAAGAAIGSMGAIFAAQAKAQTAEIDKQIAAEQKRDGKSTESLAKIKAMEKKKEEIERKAFERNKKMQMAQTVMNTAASIMGVMSGVKDPLITAPLALAQVAMFAAMGAAQLAIIQKQTFQGGSASVEKPRTALSIGKRASSVDVTQAASAGELNYLRGGRTTGQDLGGIPGGSMGRKGYAMGFKSGYADGGVVVGERGPEVITPAAPVDITPNFALGGGTTNVNFSINAIDASGVEDVLMNQQGNIIRMIRQAANENGEDFLETIDTQTYGSST